MPLTAEQRKMVDEIWKGKFTEDASLRRYLNDPVFIEAREKARDEVRKYGVGTANYIRNFMHKFTLTADPRIRFNCVRPYKL